MGLIPILDLEDLVQVGDKTRLDASKSFKTKDLASDAVTLLEITPSNLPGIDVKDLVYTENQFLDWVWADDNFDVDSSLNKIYFTENGVEKIATVSSGNYSFSGLLTAISSAMDAAGSQIYLVTQDEIGKITINSAAAFGLIARNRPANLISYLGFNLDQSAKISHTGKIAEVSRKKIVVTMETASALSESKTFYQNVITKQMDYLFSSDADLLAEEPDINKWVAPGKSSFNHVHRRAQRHIIDWIDRNGYVDSSGEKIDKWSFTDLDQVKLWSMYSALKFIFPSLSNAVDDVFMLKAKEYEALEIVARNRAVLRLALTSEDKAAGKTDEDASPNSWSGSVGRR